jgi:hypothetical protein
VLQTDLDLHYKNNKNTRKRDSKKMTKKRLLSVEEEFQLFQNILTDDDPISAKLLEIHYANEERKKHEDSEASKPII